MKRLLLIFLTIILSVCGANAQSISGTLAVCTGASVALSGSPAGGTWSSANVTIATVNASGSVTGISAGITTITYFSGSGNAYASVTVNPVPAAITGVSSLCTGGTAIESDATTGGVWSSSNPAVVSIGSSTGVISGVAAGIATVSYTVVSGCFSVKTISVNPTPSAISGASSMCTGSSYTLSCAVPGGIWSSSATAVATVSSSTGVVTPLAAGYANIVYTLGTGCATQSAVTVNVGPASITGSGNICVGSTTTLNDVTAGGVWTSSNTTVATIAGSSGNVTGISAGTATISYGLPSGCSTTTIVTVNSLPSIITGSSTVCVGGSITATTGATCGTWSSTAPCLTINTGGTITGISAGVGSITFTTCAGCSSVAYVTVNPTPSISGSPILCTGYPTTLSSTISGGAWTSSSTGIATVGYATGIVTGVSAGTVRITYTTASSCYNTLVVTVSLPANAGTITGVSSLCTGASATMSSTAAGGTWSSSDPGIANINSSTGVVTAISAGTAVLSYSVTGSCNTADATTIITINASSAISGASPACIGLTSVLSVASSCGTWSSSSSAIASVGSPGTGTTVVTGVAAGTSTITYTSCGGCVSTTIVTINSAPLPITGSHTVCVGAVFGLADATAGGTWTSNNLSVATISTIGAATGVVSGISAGVVTMTYALTAGCYATFAMTVNALPVITASAVPAPCGSDYFATLGGGVSYTWFPTTGVSCPSCSTTTIVPVSSIIYTITGTSSVGCTNTATLGINGNRISGHISFSGATPASTVSKVWLIRFNPSDNTLISVDSTITCNDGTQPYFQFESKPAGSYLVQAKLLSSVPGSSDYIPTYGGSSAYWELATAITHTALPDSLHIIMPTGTVLSGPGSISGYIYSGAGKGTSGEVPVAGMIIYLKNPVTGVILNYTYTNEAGYYSFAGLPYGNYVIYPEEYSYYTTASPTMTIGPTATSGTAHFKKHTDNGTITPFDITKLEVGSYAQNSSINLYPDPSAGLLNLDWGSNTSGMAEIAITDVAGRVVYRSAVDISGSGGTTKIDIGDNSNGIYFITVRSKELNYSGKLFLQK